MAGPRGAESPPPRTPPPEHARDLLVICVGNADRWDDGAGLEVARRLRAARVPGLAVRECSGDPAQLIDAWAGVERVVLVDAAHSRRKPGSVSCFDAVAAPLPAAALLQGSTHAFGVADAVELARALGRLPASLAVYAIEGRSFHPGRGLSPEVADAVASVVDAVRRGLHTSAAL